jgi:uncharacterized protein
MTTPRLNGQPLTYDSLHGAGLSGWWRPIAGVVLLAITTYVVAPFFAQACLAVWFGLRGEPIVAGMNDVLDLSDPTPAGLAIVNLVLASGILGAWFVTWAVHGLKPRWLASIQPRLRWRYLGMCMGLALLALFAALLAAGVVSSISPSPNVIDTSAGVNDFTTTTRNFLLVILLLTPLQAAGEEYFFRGYLTQACGGLFGPVAAVLIPAVLFALAHGLGQSPPVFVDRLAFGVIAGILVVRTGGLEAAIAMHVVNNWVAFGLALAFGDMATTLTPGEGRWVDLVTTLVQSSVYLGLALLLARQLGLRDRVGAGELAASPRRVYRFPSAQPPLNERQPPDEMAP